MAELIDLKELEERVILIAVNVAMRGRRQLLWMNWKNWQQSITFRTLHKTTI